jgi:hypothetical protein
VTTAETEPAIVTAIRTASADAHDNECRHVAAWVENVGWQFADDHFEDMLSLRGRLTVDDLGALRDFRTRLIAERSAPA